MSLSGGVQLATGDCLLRNRQFGRRVWSEPNPEVVLANPGQTQGKKRKAESDPGPPSKRIRTEETPAENPVFRGKVPEWFDPSHTFSVSVD